jgi:transcriptional regulator with XRE-family HTH domain
MLYRHALGQVLRDLRARRGWTLRKTSEKAKIALGYLSEVERGQKELSSELLENLANAYGLEVSSVIIEVAWLMAEHDFSIAEQNEIFDGLLAR